MTVPEFSRRIAIDRLGIAPQAETIAADQAERAALCARFGWLSLERLEADAVLAATAGGIDAKGRLRASVEQACVATGEPVGETIDEPFEIRFVPELAAPEDGGVEIVPDEVDVMAIDDGAVDLGEAVAQTLALALDPYPRSAGADAVVARLGAEEAGPFAGLKDLLKRD